MLDQRGRDELGRGTDITGATDGVGMGVAVASGFTGRTDGVGRGVAVAAGFAGVLGGIDALAGFGGALSNADALAGFGGALDSTEGRAFGGALDSNGDPHNAGRGSALDKAAFGASLDKASFAGVLEAGGRPESVARLGGTLDLVGFGVTLVRAKGGDDGIFGATLDDAFGTAFDGAAGTDRVGFAGMLEGRDGAGVGVALAVCSATTGTVVLIATFSGTLAESGMSSQPASMSSSPGFARLSAPIAISLKGTRTAREVAASTVRFSVEAHAKFYEPRHLHRALAAGTVAIRDRRHGRAIASLKRPGTRWHSGKRSGGGRGTIRTGTVRA